MSEKFYSKFTEKKPSQKKASGKKTPVKKTDSNKAPAKKETTGKNTAVHKSFKEKKTGANTFTKLSFLFNTDRLEPQSLKILNSFDEIIQSVRPLNSKQLQKLPDDIRFLSHQLTDQRSERRLGYMNESVQLSAYVRYYTWWNLVRLTRLFSSLPESCFPQDNQICLDIGSGPLTVITALWLSRPELRKL